jgi:hypothetical protein
MSDTTATATQATTTRVRTARRTATLALWGGGAVLLALAAVLPFQRGGFQHDDQLRALAIACAVLAVLAVAAPWPLWRGRAAAVAGLALAALAGWTWLSASWAPVRIHAQDDGWRLTLYAVFFGAALIVMRSPRVRRVTPWVLLAVVTAAGVYGLGTRLLPDVFDAEVFPRAGARLAHPITYWNGLGLFAGAGVLLGVACAAERGAAPRWARSLACAAAVPCGFASYMALSRGAFVAAAAGLVVLALIRPRATTAVAAACALVPVGVLVVALQALDKVKATPVEPPAQSGQGVALAVAVVLAAAVAGAAFALMGRRSDRARTHRRSSFRPAAVLAPAVVAVALIAIVGISYAAEQTEQVSKSTTRVGEAKTFRAPYWDVAFDTWADHPLRGAGSGSFRAEWRRAGVIATGASDAHSLYFETLAELGLVGGLTLLAFMGAVAAGLFRRSREAPSDPVLPAAAAVLAAYVVHLGVDWDWELPGVMAPALLLAAAALTRPEPALDRLHPDPAGAGPETRP